MMFRLPILLLLALMLCGCYAQDAIIRVNSNGSGTIEVHAGINKAYDAQHQETDEDRQNSPNVEVIVSTVEFTAESFPTEWQATVTPWDDGTFQGAKLVVQFTDSAMLQKQLTELLDEAKANGYSDMIDSLTSQQEQEQLRINASIVGVTIDDNGEPLSSGPEGTGRVLWSVALPQTVTCQPSRFATCANNQASWNIPFNELQPDEPLELIVEGRLSAAAPTAPTPVPPTTVPPTAVPTISPTPVPPPPVPATATLTKLPVPAVPPAVALTKLPTAVAAAEPTSTPRSLAAPTMTPTSKPDSVDSSPAPTIIDVIPEVSAPTVLPAATDVPPGNTRSTTAPQASSASATVGATPTAGAASTVLPTSSTLVAANNPTEQAFVPIIADALVAPDPAQPATQTAPARAISRRPVLPGRNVAIVVCLLGAALCLGYVGSQRLLRRRAADADSAPDEDSL